MMDEQDKEKLRKLFPDMPANKGLEALANWRNEQQDGREMLANLAKFIDREEFEEAHRLAIKLYAPEFEKIKKITGGQPIALTTFYDTINDNKLFPMTNATAIIQELFATYRFWLQGEKIYSIHQNLCQRFTATNIKNIPLELFEMPFPAFKMLIPEGTLPINTFEGKTVFMKEIFVVDYIEPDANNERILLIFYRKWDDIGFFKIHLNRDEVHQCVEDSIKHMVEFESIKTGNNEFCNEEHMRLVRNAFEFIAKAILYITGANSDVQYVDETDDLKNQLARAKSGGKRKKLQKRLEKAKKMYLVGHTIVISREERIMYDNIRKGLWTVSYRFIVQGHYRHQAYGQGRTERKLIYIQPFWKGPEFAEIVNNPHLLK